MAYITAADRVHETSTTTGTGTLTLAGAVTASQTFLAGIGATQTYYDIAHPTLNEWEVGIGTVSGGTLTRDTVIASSNSNALVSFSAGTKDVFCGMPASRALQDRPPSFRNKLRNPKGIIANRGTSFAAAVSGQYTLDGWVPTNTSAAVFTVSQAADAPTGAEYDTSIRVTVTTADAAVAAGDSVTLLQPIEGYLVRDLQGNPIAIQFDVKSPKTGTHCVSLRNSALDRSYVFTYTVSVANTWEKKYLTLPTGLITAGTWNWTTGVGLWMSWALMAGSTYQTTAGAWQTGNFLATTAQVNCMDANANVFAIGCPQLERGYEPGSLEHRSMDYETTLCSRYLRWIPFNFQFNSAGAAVSHEVPISFGTPMRAAPTLAVVTADPETTQANTNNSANTPTRPTTTSCSLSLTATAAGNTYVVGYRSLASAEL